MQDATGRLQLWLNDEGVGAEKHEDFKHWDLGDSVAMLLCPTLTINLDHLLLSKVDPTMPECVVPRNEGEPNLKVQVHQKLLKDYFNSHW